MSDANLSDVAAIIPLFNKADTIARTIDSVLAQARRPKEIIVVDDGSTDGSAEIVESRYGGVINLVRQANAGPGAARNAGAALATASNLAFLDADDEWRPAFVQEAEIALDRNPRAAAYVCGYDAGAFADVRPNKVPLLGKDGMSEPPLDADGPTLKMHVDALHSSCIVVRRDIFSDLGGYYARERCLFGEDSYLWLGLLIRYPIYWDPRPLVDFHVEDSQLGFSVTRRTSARPVVIDRDALRIGLAAGSLQAINRAIDEFARLDFRSMREAGAYFAASRLGREFGFIGPLSSLGDPLRYARRYLRAAFKVSV